jgi:hypothetical protein
VVPSFFGFDHAQRLAVHEQKVIAGTGRERHFAKCDAAARGEVHGPIILHDPAARGELGVDVEAGNLFGRFGHPNFAGKASG